MKILSENNIFRDFDGITISERNDIVELFFENGEWMESTSDHRIYCVDGIKQAKDINIGDYTITKDGIAEVIYKSKHNRPIKVFDISNVKETHNFYANGILTHNCDEFAFVPNDVDFYTSTYPVIASGKTSKIIITSTPNGLNLFYKLYTDAVNRKNNYAYYDCLWYRHPERDEAWKEETIKNTSLQQFKVEHECVFLGSSNTLLTGECLETLVFENPIHEKEDMYFYETPQDNAIYVACVDVSEGISKDFSTIQIIRVDKKPYKQVFVYHRNDISPWAFPAIIHEIVKKYNDAYLLIENNSIGKIVADSMHSEYDYDNLLSSSIKKGEDVLDGFSMENIGIRTTKKTKTVGCTALKTLIEDKHLVIQDWNTISELTTFIRKRNSYQAENGKFDDLVTPLISFAWITVQTWFEDITDTNLHGLLQEQRELAAENSHLAFGFMSTGIEDYITNF